VVPTKADKKCLTAPPEHGCVEIRGARQNNLKGIDLDLPLGQLTVITGPSGSGKSSLAFETIYAEGQRRYVETFSPYMRQFLDRMDKPRVDEIRGIPPAIAVEQANPVKSSRSTVGTMTEINDYLKLLWPRIARAFCPNCEREIRPETAKSIADEVLREHNGQSVLITFWVSVAAKTEAQEFFKFIQQQGYLRVWLNGEVVRADTDKKVGRLGARVQVIQDRITISEENRSRLVEAIETALRFGKDRINVIDLDSKKDHPYSTGWHCAHCDLDIRPPTPGLFSFNSPLGACPECRGFGRTIAIDLNRAIPDRSLSIAQGAVRVFRGEEMGESQKDLMRACAREDVDVRIPFEELPKADQDFVINGEKKIGEYTDDDYENDRWYGVRGFFRWLESKTYKMHVRVLLSRYRAYTTCPSCKGGRFQPEALNYRIASVAAVYDRRNAGRSDNTNGGHRPPLQEALTLPDVAALPVCRARDLLESISLPPNDSTAEMLRREVVTRLSYLCDVGLGYLTLDRSTRTLSGGEVQRVNLTTCLGASLVNTLFVMDEPSVGLHPRDVGRLIRVIHNLRDKGNTLLVVEHEEAIIRAADHLIDIGPGRGEQGGELVFEGALSEMLGSARGPRAVIGGPPITSRDVPSLTSLVNHTGSQRAAAATAPHSLTRDYLLGEKRVPVPKSRRKFTSVIKITGARENNLSNIDVEIPLGVFTCVTGVSGSAPAPRRQPSDGRLERERQEERGHEDREDVAQAVEQIQQQQDRERARDHDDEQAPPAEPERLGHPSRQGVTVGRLSHRGRD
jgi:excinuclease ABC subunit A